MVLEMARSGITDTPVELCDQVLRVVVITLLRSLYNMMDRLETPYAVALAQDELSGFHVRGIVALLTQYPKPRLASARRHMLVCLQVGPLAFAFAREDELCATDVCFTSWQRLSHVVYSEMIFERHIITRGRLTKE